VRPREEVAGEDVNKSPFRKWHVVRAFSGSTSETRVYAKSGSVDITRQARPSSFLFLPAFLPTTPHRTMPTIGYADSTTSLHLIDTAESRRNRREAEEEEAALASMDALKPEAIVSS
jgi:hypothetical protein